ncbi:MAG: hypothetical protein B6247_03175 [Candidatus Parabeggiatoa sp. nov. 2]|nr:MAG: hypothetical protein B6247_03175 [Beggiatoa sp. 4572_84]
MTNRPHKGEQSPTTNWPTKGGNPSYDHVEYNNHLRLTGPHEQSPTTNWPTKGYTQEGNKRDFLRNKNNFEKPQRDSLGQRPRKSKL